MTPALNTESKKKRRGGGRESAPWGMRGGTGYKGLTKVFGDSTKNPPTAPDLFNMVGGKQLKNLRS